MNFQKFTQKSIEAVEAAQNLAAQNGNQQIEQEHMLLALLEQENGLAGELVRKAGASPELLTEQLRGAIDRMVKLSGTDGRVYLSRDLDRALQEAEALASRMKDEYVSVEHIVLGIIEHPSDGMKNILKNAGLTKDKFISAVKSVRGNQTVKTDNPDRIWSNLRAHRSWIRSSDATRRSGTSYAS